MLRIVSGALPTVCIPTWTGTAGWGTRLPARSRPTSCAMRRDEPTQRPDGDHGRVGEEDGACATTTVSENRRRPSSLVAHHTMRTGTSGATGSHMSFRV